MNATEEAVFNGLVLEQYKKWTLNEIKYAFRLAISGKLKVDIYAKLDAKLLGLVMTSYDNHKSEKIKHHLASQPKMQIANIPNKAEKEAIEKEFNQTCIFPYLNEFKLLKTPAISSEHFLIFKKLLDKKVFDVTVNDVLFYKTMAEKKIEEEKKQAKASAISKANFAKIKPEKNLKIYAACLCMHDKLTQLVDDGIDLLKFV